MAIDLLKHLIFPLPSGYPGALGELFVFTWDWRRVAHLSWSAPIISIRSSHQAVKRPWDNGKGQVHPVESAVTP